MCRIRTLGFVVLSGLLTAACSHTNTIENGSGKTVADIGLSNSSVKEQIRRTSLWEECLQRYHGKPDADEECQRWFAGERKEQQFRWPYYPYANPFGLGMPSGAYFRR